MRSWRKVLAALAAVVALSLAAFAPASQACNHGGRSWHGQEATHRTHRHNCHHGWACHHPAPEEEEGPIIF